MRQKLYKSVGIVVSLLVAATVLVFTNMPYLAVLTFVTSTIAVLSLVTQLSPKKQIKEGLVVKELESFLTIFASKLKLGNSPECSYKKALQNYNGVLRTELVKLNKKIINGSQFSNTFNSITQNPSLKQCRPLIFISCKLTEMDSKKAGETIEQMVLRFRENRKLIEEREHLVRSLSFKTKVLTVACSASLAMMLAMLPLFSSLTILHTISGLQVTFQVHWLLAAAFSLTATVSAYYTGVASLAENPYLYSIASFLIFWLVFFASSSLVSSFFAY